MTVATCGDCGSIYVRTEGHRCKPTTVGNFADALGSFVDAVKRMADLERQVVDLKAENARLRGEEEGHG